MNYFGGLGLVLLQGVMLVVGKPQGGYNYPAPQRPQQSSASAQAYSPDLQGFAANSNSQFAASSSGFSQQPSTFGSFGGGGGGGGGSGGNLQVECQRQETSPGRFKFVCSGVNPEAISLRSEHILWLDGPAGQKQVVDIEVPNYKIEELIKAGFKQGGEGGTNINVLLKRPQQNYDAQVDTLTPAGGIPNVNLQYEPVQKQVIHFPNDKPYSPLQGPLVPPGGRGQRSTVRRY